MYWWFHQKPGGEDKGGRNWVNEKLECVEKFCYLGDMIGAGGGVEEASRARVRCAWAKFRELAPILTSRGASLVVKGKVYKACVQRVMVYGSETWAIKTDDLLRLERAEKMMVRWMCGVTLKNRISSLERYWALDRVRWRGAICGNRPTRACMEKWT